MLANIIQTTPDYETLNVNQGTAYSTPRSMNTTSTISVQVKIDVPSAVVFASSDINTTNDTMTKAGAVLWTGVKGQFTTSGALPTGISAMTNYWAVVSDLATGTYKFATSLANALAGTVVDITAAGTGNQTFTPTSIAGGNINFQKTNILSASSNTLSTTAADWTDIETDTAVTADATVWWAKIGPEYAGWRVRGVTSDGAYQAKLYIVTRGEDKK